MGDAIGFRKQLSTTLFEAFELEIAVNYPVHTWTRNASFMGNLKLICAFWLVLLTEHVLRLTSRKPLWLDLQPVDVKSGWRHNWKSAQVVNSHLVYDPPQSGNRVSTSLGNSGLCWTVFARNRDTVVPAEGNGDLLICVLVARPRRCLTLSNPVPWQIWEEEDWTQIMQHQILLHVSDTNHKAEKTLT